MLRKYIYNLPFAVLYIICCLVSVFYSGGTVDGQLWKGFYTIAYAADSEPDFAARLAGAGFDAVTEENACVVYNDFHTMRRVMLSEIDERFVANDPRLDPFMTQAASYFRASADGGMQYKIAYVRSSDPPVPFYFSLRKNMGKGDYFIADLSIPEKTAAVLLFLLAWAAGVWLFKGLRMWALFGGMPWFCLVAFSGSGFLPAAVLMYMVFLVAFREVFREIMFYLNYGERNIPAAKRIYLSVFISVAFFSSVFRWGFSGLPVFPALAAMAADGLLVFLYVGIGRSKTRKQEHRLFFHVPMKDERNWLYLKAFAVVLVLPLFMLAVPGKPAIGVPVQIRIEGVEGTEWEDIELLSRSRPTDALPDVSSIIAHAAYQDGFMYGMQYSFPLRGEALEIARYIDNGNGIEYTEYPVRQFTEDWYNSIIGREKQTGLGRLLLSQPVPGRVAYSNEHQIKSAGIEVPVHLIISLMVFLPSIWLSISAIKINLRSKGQEA